MSMPTTAFPPVLTMFVVLALSASQCFAQNGSLLIDFHGTDNGGPLGSISSDFAVHDTQLDVSLPGTSVNLYATEGPGIDPNITGVLNNGLVIEATGNFRGAGEDNPFTGNPLSFTGFNIPAASTLPSNDIPLLDGYAVATNSEDLIFEINGLEEIAAGSEIIVTVYGHGDQTNQGGLLAISYNDVIQASDSVTELPITPTPLELSDFDDTFRQFTIVTVEGVDSLLVNADGEAFFTAINAISLNIVTEQPEIVGLDGDFNEDGVVNAADYTILRDGAGLSGGADIPSDFNEFVDNFGSELPLGVSLAVTSVPEPTGLAFVATIIGFAGLRRRRS